MLKFNLFAVVFLIVISVHGQKKSWLERKNIDIVKNGPYFGIQKGKFIVAEFGGERQWKDYKLKKPKTHALNLGFNYDFTNNVLGYDIGYWYKSSNVGMTFGSSVILRSDFTHTQLGFTPIIGYKFWQLHAQTGYQFLLKTSSNSFETNKLFISLRFVLINNTKIKK